MVSCYFPHVRNVTENTNNKLKCFKHGIQNGLETDPKTIATPVNNENAVTYIFYDDGTLQWGLENGEQFTDEYCIYHYPGNIDSLIFEYGEFSKWIRFPSSPDDGDTIVVSSVLYELEDF